MKIRFALKAQAFRYPARGDIIFPDRVVSLEILSLRREDFELLKSRMRGTDVCSSSDGENLNMDEKGKAVLIEAAAPTIEALLDAVRKDGVHVKRYSAGAFHHLGDYNLGNIE